MDEGFVAGCSVSSERLRVIGRLGLLSEYSVPRRAPGNSTDPGSVRFVAEIVPFIAKYWMMYGPIDLPLRGASARSLRARHELYQLARRSHPRRWASATRNCTPIGLVVLNPG